MDEVQDATMKKLVCKNCGYSWKYNGVALFYATCPRCLRKVKLKVVKRGCDNGK